MPKENFVFFLWLRCQGISQNPQNSSTHLFLAVAQFRGDAQFQLVDALSQVLHLGKVARFRFIVAAVTRVAFEKASREWSWWFDGSICMNFDYIKCIYILHIYTYRLGNSQFLTIPKKRWVYVTEPSFKMVKSFFAIPSSIQLAAFWKETKMQCPSKGQIVDAAKKCIK